MRRLSGLPVLFLAGILLFSACAGMVRFKQESPAAQQDRLRQLQDRWEAYHIYATLWRGDQVKAILFDPKADERKILAERWVQVQSKEELSRFLGQTSSGQSPRLYMILGPQGEPYGYLYSTTTDIQTQLLDDRTLRVYEMKMPNSPAA